MATLSLKNLVKDYGDVRVVRDFNLDVADKEFIVLVGPSGCGKSTTLRMIAGLEEITAGELQIDGKRMNDVAPKDRDIAMVFQSYALYPHMTVFDNMAFGLKLRKYPSAEIEKRVKNASEILGLEELLDRKPKALSGGQRQRVAMGRAIVREPKVFLFDEPLSNLDAKLRVQMRSEIAKLHRNLGATSIYVTHDQTEAMTLATRIVVMNGGIAQQVGSPLELYQTPSNLFVAGFIGSPSMNFLEGEVVNGGKSLKGEGFQIPLWPGLPSFSNGRKLVFGMRPEHAHLKGAEAIGAGEIHARVDYMEPMGAELFVFFHVADRTVVGRFDPEMSFTVGDEVILSADLERCHLFDPETEEAIRTH